jgi:hypothetical protein
MAIDNVVVTVVDVGQGQCTFVEVYDATPALIHTLLFDCGTNRSSASESVNLDYIVARVSGMAIPAFDCIFFSHSDTDHTNLTAALLLKFAAKPRVKKVWYGGDVDHYTVGTAFFNIINYLVDEGYCTWANISAPLPDFSDYASPGWNGELWKTGDGVTNVQVHSIMANVLKAAPELSSMHRPRKKQKVAEVANRVSIVCALYYAGASHVICGDATNKTMATINTLFRAGTTVFDKNHMTTAPHHGSRKTGFNVTSSAKASAIAAKTVTDFGTLLKSKTISVSAYSHHKHPSLELLNCFIPTITAPFLKDINFIGNMHRIVAFNDVNNSIELKKANGTKLPVGYHPFNTPTCIFPTWYTPHFVLTAYTYKFGTALVSNGAPTIPGANSYPNACWQYEIGSGGGLTLGGYPNLAFTSTLFTAAATSSSAGMAIAPIAGTKTIAQELPALEIKRRVQQPRSPAQRTPQLGSRLKQFH